MDEQHSSFKTWIRENRLLTVELAKEQAGKAVFVGQMLKYDDALNSFLFYDQDLKNVWHLRWDEIRNIQLLSGS